MARQINLLNFYIDGRLDFDALIAAVSGIVAGRNGSIINYSSTREILDNIGIAADSTEGRALVTAIPNLIRATAYRKSAEMAAEAGDKSATGKQVVAVQRKFDASMKLTDQVVDTMKLPINIDEILFAANREWDHALYLGKKSGWLYNSIMVSESSETECPSCHIGMCPIGKRYMCGLCGVIIQNR